MQMERKMKWKNWSTHKTNFKVYVLWTTEPEKRKIIFINETIYSNYLKNNKDANNKRKICYR